MTTPTADLVTYDEAAEMLHVHVVTIYRLLSSNQLHSHPILGSKRKYIARREIEDLRDRRLGLVPEVESTPVRDRSPAEVRERAVAAAAPMIQAWREMLPGLASIGIAALAPAASEIGAGSDPKW